MTGIQLKLRDDFNPSHFSKVGMVYCRVGKVIIELDQYVIGNMAWIHITDWRLSLVTQHTHVVASGTVYCCIWFATPPMNTYDAFAPSSDGSNWVTEYIISWRRNIRGLWSFLHSWPQKISSVSRPLNRPYCHTRLLFWFVVLITLSWTFLMLPTENPPFVYGWFSDLNARSVRLPSQPCLITGG